MGSLKPVGVWPGIISERCKIHKDIVSNFLAFQPINTPTNKLLAKFLVPI